MTSLSRLLRVRWPAVALPCLGLLLHVRELLGEVPFERDIHRIFVPGKQFIAGQLQRGEWPEWWPWDGMGMPFLAQPLFSFFHPTTLLFALVEFWTAFTLQRLLATVAGLGGMYLLARALRLPRTAAFVAASLYGLNGYVVGLGEFTFSQLAAAALPWYGWGLLQAMRRGGLYLLAPSAAMSLLLLAGDVQMALLGAFAGLVLLLPLSPDRRAIWLCLLAPAAGALLASAQLVPALSITPDTLRASALPYEEANQWPLGLRHLAALALPFDLGAWDFVRSTWLGIPALALAASGVSLGRRRAAVLPLTGLVLLSLWLAAGDQLGLNALARTLVPFWSEFRYPIKSAILAYLALPLLAGFGFVALTRTGTRKHALVGVAAAGACALAAWLFIQPPFGVTLQALASVAAAGIICIAAPRGGRAALLAGLAVAAHQLVIVDPFLRTTEQTFFQAPPLARSLTRAGGSIQGPYFEPMSSRQRTEAESAPASMASLVPASNAMWGVPTSLGYLPARSRRLHALQLENQSAWTSRLAGVFSAEFAIIDEPVPERLKAQVVDTDPRFGLALIRRKQALPRAYAVHRAHCVPDEQQARNRLLSQFLPGREVIVESDACGDWANRPDQLAVPVQFTARTANTVGLEAELPWPGFVVLNEAYFDGWSASVNGSPSPLLIANGVVRAVEVPAGRSSVVMTYRTPGLAVGAAISGLAVLGHALAAALLRRRSGPRHLRERQTEQS